MTDLGSLVMNTFVRKHSLAVKGFAGAARGGDAKSPARQDAGRGDFFLQECLRLLTETEGLHDSTVALDVFTLEVVKQCATLTYELNESTFSCMIFTVCSHVFRQVGNTV